MQASGVTLEIMSRYVSYLIAVGFLEKPPARTAAGGLTLPNIELVEGQKEALGKVGGRGAMV